MKKLMQSMAICIATILILPNAYAIATCNNVRILRVTPEGTRDDQIPFQNNLIIELADQNGNPTTCGGANYFYLPATDPNYNRVLTVATAALVSGHTINIAVNTTAQYTMNIASNIIAYQIAYLSIQ